MKPANFATTFRPLYTISIITGFLFFTINLHDFTATFKMWNFLTLSLMMAANVAMSFSYWFVDIFQTFVDIGIAQKSTPLLIGFDHITLIFAIVWFLKCRHDFVKFLKIIVDIDENLLEFGVKIDHDLQKRKLIKIVTGVFFVMAGLQFYNWHVHNINYSLPMLVFSTWIFAVWLVFLVNFVFCAVAIGQRFEMMNRCIDSQATPKLSQIHLKIGETVKIFNGVFGQPMMFIFGSLFAWNCMTAFTFLMMPKIDLGQIATIVQVGMSILLTFIELVVTIRAASRAQNAKAKAVELLYKLMNTTNGGRNEIVNFISQISHTNVTLGCKFFDFNFKFLFQVSFGFGVVCGFAEE
jgi:hypothetical protein